MSIISLNSLMSFNESWNSVIIHDSTKQNGVHFLKSSIVNIYERFDHVHLFCYEYPKSKMMDSLPAHVLDRITCYDFYSDPQGWEGGNQNIHTDVITFAKENISHNDKKKVLIVFSTLDMLLSNRPVAYTCRTLHSLTHSSFNHAIEQCCVMALVHNLHDDETIIPLNHIFSTVIYIKPSSWSTHKYRCSITHKKKSGKVLKSEENFNIDGRFQFTDITKVESLDIAAKTATCTISESDPAANLTFNLRLSNSEKDARSRVKLPYMQEKNKNEVTLHKAERDAKIFYQPDEADDFDEDDPDDDLDI